MINTHIQATKSESITRASAITHASDICSLTSPSLMSTSNAWILNFGTSRHICHHHALFHNWCRVYHMAVILPASLRVSVDFMGDIQVSDQLILQNVFYPKMYI